MNIGVLLLCCTVLGVVHQWSSTTDGLWSDSNNWDPKLIPSTSSSVVLPPQYTSITVTIGSNVAVSSLSLSSNVVLLFQNNSTLTISDALVLIGGTLRTDPSSSSSSTSVDTLVLAGDFDHTILNSHKLIVNRLFDWRHGLFELDSLSELVFVNVINVRLESSQQYSHPDLFLYYNWYSSLNVIDRTGRHDPSDVIMDGPLWKSDADGGYLEIIPGNSLEIPNLPGVQGWRGASLSIWIWFEEGQIGLNLLGACQFYIRPTSIQVGNSQSSFSLPRSKWFHLTVTATARDAYVYTDGSYIGGIQLSTAYNCGEPPLYFSLSQVGTNRFEGKVRAVQFFTKTLTIDEINELFYEPPTGILGEGKLSLVNSEVKMLSSKFDLRSITLTSSILQSNEATFDELQSLQLYSDSSVSLTQDTMILSKDISIVLDSSELYYDDSVDFSSATLSLIAINSRFLNDFGFSIIHVLELSWSTFESLSYIEIVVGCFYCNYCQILGNSEYVVSQVPRINTGNFSTSLIFQSTVVNSLVSGQVQLSDSIDLSSHVTFDDVSVSEFQSSGGSITCHSDVLMRNDVTFSFVGFYHTFDVVLSESNVKLNQDFTLLNFQILSGSGVIFDTTLNSGKIIPLPLIVFESNLVLSLSSTISIQIVESNSSTKIIVGSTVYLDGTLEVDFDPFKHWSGHEFLLVDSSNLVGEFTFIQSTCSSIFNVIYNSSGVLGSFDEYIAHLNTVSYISTTGIDDPCCGTFDSPCASFKGVLERMGRKGKVYFHEGSYSFQGLGKVTEADWEVIGLGDVMIEGLGETLFELLHSKIFISNIVFNCKSDICFSLTNSTFHVVLSDILHEAGIFMFLTESSEVTIASCYLESNASNILKSIDSNLVLLEVYITGFVQDSLINLENSNIQIDRSNFSNIESFHLFQLKQSHIQLIDSLCSNSNFYITLFDLFQINTETVYEINDSVFELIDFSFSLGICFDYFISAEVSQVVLNNFIMRNFDTNSVVYVYNSNLLLQNNLFQSITCQSLIESVNSLIELNEVTISNVTCNTCFDLFANNLFVQFMDVFSTSGDLFKLSEVELIDLDILNIYDSHMDTIILAANVYLDIKNVSVSDSDMRHFFNAKNLLVHATVLTSTI
ncbi:hypothetical protein GEMRC1_008708 [Eukaryota sp. GEM-RC1]